jgi:dTDP-4-dehydrorhamnose 3,5-epimerase
VKLAATKIPGAFVVTFESHSDERGYFGRTYSMETLHEAGAPLGAIRQMSISFNKQRGTLRGMHWQAAPQPEGKIVRVSAGRIFDCIVDLRRDSVAYLQYFAIELDARLHNAVVVPPLCAHGFLTLTDDCAVEYAMDADYVPELARGARWNDPAFAIDWPALPSVIGERDKVWPDFVP